MYKTFGQTVKELRIERKMSLRSVAARLKISTYQLKRLENDKRFPTYMQFAILGYIYGVNHFKLKRVYLTDTFLLVLMMAGDLGQESLVMALEAYREREQKKLKPKRDEKTK